MTGLQQLHGPACSTCDVICCKLARCLQLITAPYDPRFPNRNQARHCFVRFNEYYK